MYLLAYLEEEYGDISVYLSTKEEVSHMWGIQYLCRPWRSGEDFLWQCKKARPSVTSSPVDGSAYLSHEPALCMTPPLLLPRVCWATVHKLFAT